MPLTITELYETFDLTEGRREGRWEEELKRRFIIKGSDDPTSAVVRKLGPQRGERYAGDGSLTLYVISRSYKILKNGGAAGAVELNVTYGPAERLPSPTEAEDEYELSTMAETVHIEEALSQNAYPSDLNGVGRAVGVNGDKIDGVDIYVPKGTYTQTKDRQLNAGYLRILQDLTGKVNRSPWKFWQPGEVLFLGANAKRKGDGIWRVQYSFSIQLNAQQSINASSGVLSFFKRGWEYLWFERAKTADGSGTAVEHKIEVAHVAQVYDTREFSLLGLGL